MEIGGILLYGIADEQDNSILEISGMDEKQKLYYIEHSGLYAIVSNVSLVEYGEEAMAEKSEDIDWLKEKAVIFMDIILKINTLTRIIPMKFLTIFNSSERVKEIIEENREMFQTNLAKIKNRKELSLKIYCDDKIYKEKTMAEEVKKFEEGLKGKPKGAAFFLKKKFDGELDDKIQNRIYDLSNKMAESVMDFVVEKKVNKLLAKEITGITTPMILNYAYLVDSEKEELLAGKVEELKHKYGSCGFMIELSGPWPPYSFCE